MMTETGLEGSQIVSIAVCTMYRYLHTTSSKASLTARERMKLSASFLTRISYVFTAQRTVPIISEFRFPIR